MATSVLVPGPDWLFFLQIANSWSQGVESLVVFILFFDVLVAFLVG